ncbi:DNA polymerase [Alkalibacterium thalassium]|uniref:DNA-directed DNA polymerase n=1 Tax=Alkalibacterium thalassium TaxID=426701 RepID=A0A1G8VF44_9LACT|nr:DNA polymerase [Alkalibacterium thalassium]SDJ63750.1 DNA polymerase [Alkalibacterium thalassium]
MKTLSIDIESYSSVDLAKSGVYRYIESPDFEILLFGYSIDGGDIEVIDLASGKKLPEEIQSALTDPSITKWAFNAQFERICLSKWLGFPNGQYLSPKSWRCTMVWSAYMGLPLSLEGSGAVLGLKKQKLSEGKDLIRYFCKPCNPTATNGGRSRNLPVHAPDKWSEFKSYNLRDVEAEIAIQEKLSKFPVPEEVWNEYHLDQEINDRGVSLDMPFVNEAIKMDTRSRSELLQKMKRLTDLDNPNSVAQMKNWLSDQGLETDSLGKKVVSELLETAPPDLKEVLELRQSLAKSSVKKYSAMENAVCADGRARGMFQFYGANRTGRWAGRIIQLQNLPQNHLPDLEQARALVRCGNFEAIEMLYDSIPEVLSELIRTSFIPNPGRKFIVADFSAIEARVIAWLAGEKWRQQVFESGGDIYCASASQMFGVPVEKHGVNGHLRQKGKIAELALGYGGSVGALKAMGALEMGLNEDELQPLVTAWRTTNPNIVRLWWDVDKAAMKAVRERTVTETHGIRFSYQSGMLFITLPSGRRLSYVKPRIGTNMFGSDCITYEGVGGTKKWERIDSYGPKFVENIVQATSRDLLCYSMQSLKDFNIVIHVHDEIVIEAGMESSIESICNQMSHTPPWAKGLLMRADGYETNFYKKD